MFDNLVNITVIFLQLLVSEYESGAINLDDFNKHVQTKIQFLKNNTAVLNKINQKCLVEDIIKACEKITQLRTV